MKDDMTLDEFINIVEAFENDDNGYTVLLPLKNNTTSVMAIEGCTSEYEAKERAYLYLKSLIKHK